MSLTLDGLEIMKCTVKYNGTVIGNADLILTDPSMGVVCGVFNDVGKMVIIETLKNIMISEGLTFNIFDTNTKCIDTGPMKNVNVILPNDEVVNCTGLHFLGFYDEDINLELYGVTNWNVNV